MQAVYLQTLKYDRVRSLLDNNLRKLTKMISKCEDSAL